MGELIARLAPIFGFILEDQERTVGALDPELHRCHAPDRQARGAGGAHRRSPGHRTRERRGGILNQYEAITRPTIRIKAVRALLRLAFWLAKARWAEFTIEVKTNPDKTLKTCLISIEGFEVFDYQDDETKRIAKAIEELAEGI